MNNKSELETILSEFELKLGNAYELTVHNPENILSGKVIYTGNHFHFLDPMFICYTISRKTDLFTHALAKPELFDMPFIKKYLKMSQAIKTPRINKEGLSSLKKYLPQMKQEISNYLSKNEAIYFAYAGTRTNNFVPNKESRDLEKELAKSGLIGILKEYDKTLNLPIVPIAIDTYQKDSKTVFLSGILAMLGLYNPKQKIPVDIMFGSPINIGTFLSSKNELGNRNTKKDLMNYLVDNIYNMRYELFLINKDNLNKSLNKYII